jgi:hypothetical protein
VIIADFRSCIFVEIADTYNAGGFKGITIAVCKAQRSTARVSYYVSPYLIVHDHCFIDEGKSGWLETYVNSR